jgi:4-coumarate--CoA ligase
LGHRSDLVSHGVCTRKLTLTAFADRIKDLIKVNGYQVSPAELESIILGHPKVIDCAVGRRQADATEMPVAFLCTAPEDRNGEIAEAVCSFAAKQVVHYKRITGGVYFLDSIPRK